MFSSQASRRLSQCPACCHEAASNGQLSDASHCPWVDEILTIFVASSGAERVQTTRMLSALAPCQQPRPDEHAYSAPVEGLAAHRRAPGGDRHLRLLS